MLKGFLDWLTTFFELLFLFGGIVLLCQSPSLENLFLFLIIITIYMTKKAIVSAINLLTKEIKTKTRDSVI